MKALKYNVSLPWTERLWKQLSQAEQPANSVLFFGKNGLGKTNTALRYASELLAAENVFHSANHPDLHVIMAESEAETYAETVNLEENKAPNKELSPEILLSIYAQRYFEKRSTKAKKIISVQQIRSLIEQVTQHPHLAEKKVIIIKNAGKMNVNASNALLKTLEEPPENTVFILIANQIESLPITIRSRCVEFHFRAPDKEIGLQWLNQQGLNEHTETYLMMASRAPLAALSLSVQNEIENLRTIFSFINQLWAKKISSIEIVNEWKNHKPLLIIKHLNQFFQDLLKVKSLEKTRNWPTHITEFFYPIQLEWTKKIAKTIPIEHMFSMLEELQNIEKLSSSPVDQQLLLEKMAIRLEKLALNNANLV